MGLAAVASFLFAILLGPNYLAPHWASAVFTGTPLGYLLDSLSVATVIWE